jgi:NADH:ubiquinone oxidoreductase subunit 4 (subunit M)
VLIFGPLLAAAVALAIRDERTLRWWTLGVTLAAAGFRCRLYGRFDASTAAFQFVEDRLWIPG